MLNYGLRKWILLVMCCLVFAVYASAYALNIDKVKVPFLRSDYKSAIFEGEKILAKSTAHSPELDELYYILGLSYLKDGNYLRASDIFEIMTKEFKDSPLEDEAKLSLGDTYFLRGDYDNAQRHYAGLLKSNPRTKLRSQLYYRLSRVGLKKGDNQQAQEYLGKLKDEFPLSLEIRLDKDLYALEDIYFAVQVGSFVNHVNARNLREKLIGSGYDAYLQEVVIDSAKTYRVRVGRLKSRPEAARLEIRLSSEGYPTKIVP